MDARLDQAPVVATFAEAVRPVVGAVGFYGGGSLALGDFHLGVSDLDLAAVVADEIDDQQCERLVTLHAALLRDEPSAAKLHCVYVPLGDIANLGAEQLTWAHGELYRRPFSGIGRAELLRDGITVFGPPPAELFPDVSVEALKAAVRAELTGYWSGAVRKPWLWLEDVYVDLGLVILARAEATLADGSLISKREALARLDRFDVPADLISQIAARRRGDAVELTTVQRAQRAVIARRLVARGINTLTQPPPPAR